MIKNVSKNKTISSKASLKSGLKRVKGLMFDKNIEAIVFNTRFGIHTFFLKAPIDLLILDKNKKVVVIKEGIKPFRIAVWNPRHDLVVELPLGSIKNSETAIGDAIELNL